VSRRYLTSGIWASQVGKGMVKTATGQNGDKSKRSVLLSVRMDGK